MNGSYTLNANGRQVNIYPVQISELIKELTTTVFGDITDQEDRSEILLMEFDQFSNDLDKVKGSLLSKLQKGIDKLLEKRSLFAATMYKGQASKAVLQSIDNDISRFKTIIQSIDK